MAVSDVDEITLRLIYLDPLDEICLTNKAGKGQKLEPRDSSASIRAARFNQADQARYEVAKRSLIGTWKGVTAEIERDISSVT